MSPNKPTLWIYLAVAVALVLLGGAFAGLTIALMGQVILQCYSRLDQKRGDMLIVCRMKFTYKLSRRLAKVLRKAMRPECYDY